MMMGLGKENIGEVVGGRDIYKITKLSGSNVLSGFHSFEDSQLGHDIETGKDCELAITTAQRKACSRSDLQRCLKN